MAAPIWPVQFRQVLVVDQRGDHLQAPSAEQTGNREGTGGEAEHNRRAGQHAGHDLRQHHFADHRELARSQGQRGLFGGRVEFLQRGPDRNDHERQHHVDQGDDHGERRIEQLHRRAAEGLQGLVDQAVGAEQKAPAEGAHHH